MRILWVGLWFAVAIGGMDEAVWAQAEKNTETRTFYVGTMADATGDATLSPSRGVYRVDINMKDGTHRVALAAEAPGTTFLARHPTHPVLYGVTGQAVLAWKIESDGRLTLLNQRSSQGQGACHVSVHPSGRFLFVANYGSGHAVVWKLEETGAIAETFSVFAQTGDGPNRSRQTGPHAHFMQSDPAGKYALCCDLGADRIFSYHLNSETDTWERNPTRPFATSASGTGPRHAAFAPNKKYVYVLNELSCTVDAFAYDEADGTLMHVQTAATLPPGYHGVNKAAAIAIHPSGKYLYVSNRGADLVTVFAVDDTPTDVLRGEASVVLQPIQTLPSGGAAPRFLGLTSDGQYLMACNKKTHALVFFHVNPQTGKLTPTGWSVRIAWCCAVQ